MLEGHGMSQKSMEGQASCAPGMGSTLRLDIRVRMYVSAPMALVWLDGGLMNYLRYDKDSLQILERSSNMVAVGYLRTLGS